MRYAPKPSMTICLLKCEMRMFAVTFASSSPISFRFRRATIVLLDSNQRGIGFVSSFFRSGEGRMSSTAPALPCCLRCAHDQTRHRAVLYVIRSSSGRSAAGNSRDSRPCTRSGLRPCFLNLISTIVTAASSGTC